MVGVTRNSKRWIWITMVVVALLGLFSWRYLRDDELLPDDDSIVERTPFTEAENGYDLVMSSVGAWRFNDRAKQWYGD